MRICSFLPSSTEILFALGLGDSVVGVTFECDHPAEAREKPVVVYSKMPPGLSEREIDTKVNETYGSGQSLYRLDAEKLRASKPDLVITQDLCHVCAASPDDLAAVLDTLSPRPEVLCLSPHTLADVWNDVLLVGEATDRVAAARELIAALKTSVESVSKHSVTSRPRVLCLEWLDPPFVGGHWVPEMVALAGGVEVLGRAGLPGVQVTWEQIVASDPDIILAMPCGYHREEVAQELRVVPFPPEWFSLRAVKDGMVFAMDSSSHFSRPGPRLSEGIREIAALFREHAPRKLAAAGARRSHFSRTAERP
ncbi:MAG TPA: cobalamin-binding protein [Terriglobales bacterium]|nr:cobalamin-binding protein [Terriglobales bacterium]